MVLKLPFNIGQDPYSVAQDFIHQHQLPQEYLDTIADFIVKNSRTPMQWQLGASCDPLTGGNAYVSGSGGVQSSSFTNNGVSDPLTGSTLGEGGSIFDSENFSLAIKFLAELWPFRFFTKSTKI